MIKLTLACNQDEKFIDGLRVAATCVNPHNAQRKLLDVFDALVELIVARTIIHRGVLIGGAARLWGRLIHVSLERGIDGANAPQVLRDILVSLSEWLEQSSFYVQVSDQKNQCTRLIQVNQISVSSTSKSNRPFSFRFQEIIEFVAPPKTDTDVSSDDSDDDHDSDADDDSSDGQAPPPPPRHNLHEWHSRKKVKRDDSKKSIPIPTER
jgi:hypothetical protein